MALFGFGCMQHARTPETQVWPEWACRATGQAETGPGVPGDADEDPIPAVAGQMTEGAAAAKYQFDRGRWLQAITLLTEVANG